jgi:4'-phosphopantetheinyl transferase
MNSTLDLVLTPLLSKLTAAELAYIKSPSDDVIKLRRIFAFWTLKESYVKAIGEGLYFDFKRIEFKLTGQENSLKSTAIALLDGTELLDWQFILMEVEIGYLAALTIRNRKNQIWTPCFPSFSDIVAAAEL